MAQTWEQRRSLRSSVVMSASCRSSGMRQFVAVANLTVDGCCVMTKKPVLEKGAAVTLQPETLAPLAAQVQWAKGPYAGLRFEQPLYGPVFEHLANRFGRSDDAAVTAGQLEFQGPHDLAALRDTLLRHIMAAEAKAALRESGQFTLLRHRSSPCRPAVKLVSSTRP